MFGDLFLRMFDLRNFQLSSITGYSYDVAEIEEFEDIINESAINMVYKLNDTTFRPLFVRMLEWTTVLTSKDVKATVRRQTTWYTFLPKFFGTLKVSSRNGLGQRSLIMILQVYRHQLRCFHHRRRRRDT